jgi:acetoin utilization deacetylase AcuC-like enzyme
MTDIIDHKLISRKRNGIFLPHFQGQRLMDFPQSLADILDKENVHYYNGVYRVADGASYVMPATEDTLLKVHSQEMINMVKRMGRGLFEGASYSAGVTVQAALEIYRGNIDNAFVFTGFGDHHAGRNYFGGMCYFNGAAVAIATLREKGMTRFAIVDTDSHHADGTRDIFGQDREVLHICFCFQDYSDGNNNVDVAIPCGIGDEALLQKLREEFVPRVNAFRPELIFWEFGYDATRGEYGDKGLTRDCHLEITRIIKSTADALCHGRLIAILCGGSSRCLATYIIPRIIAQMAELD